MLLKKRAIQLLQQRQDSNDGNLIKFLIEGFSNQNESSFKSFEIPTIFSIEHVQEILSEIDKRLYVSYSVENNNFLISII